MGPAAFRRRSASQDLPDSAEPTPGSCRSWPQDCGPKTLSDLPGPSANPVVKLLPQTAKAKAAPAAWGGVNLEDAVEGAEEHVDTADVATGATNFLENLLAQQTQILTQLAANSSKAQDPLSLLSGSAGSEEDSKLTGVKGMAARQLLREQFQKHPGNVYKRVRERLAQARRKPSVTALEPRDMFYRFQETVPLGNYKTLTYLAFLLCDAWEALESGHVEQVTALVSLGLVFCEQVANEQGHTRLAWLNCAGGAEARSEVRGPPRDALRPQVGGDPAGLLARRGHDPGANQQGPPFQAPCAARGGDQRWQGARTARQRPEGGSRARGMSGRLRDFEALFPRGLDDTVAASNVCLCIVKFLAGVRTKLSNFILDACALPVVGTASQSSPELWPCRIPPPQPKPRSRLSGRRKARWHLRNLARLWTRHLVAAGNWLVLGRPEVHPADLPPNSVAQESMISRLESQVTIWFRLGTGPRRDLGRSVQKFSSVEEQLESLLHHSQQLHTQFQPYCPRQKSHDATSQSEPEERCPEPLRAAAPESPPKIAVAKPASLQIQPERLVFEAKPRFQAGPFLVGKPRLARVQATKEHQLELYRKWDAVDSLFLLPASASEFRYRCGLFAVYKDDKVDRQILNPIPENSRSFSVADSTLSLAHACLLCQLYLPAEENLVIGSDDLKDFYHNFYVTDAHASRNHIHGVFPGSLFRGWRAYKPELDSVPVVGCFRTL